MTRPQFKLPVRHGVTVVTQTYVGHGYNEYVTSCKCDMYFLTKAGGAWDWPTSDVLASAEGLVHEHFDPGGIEIDHGNGWFTVYLHMDKRAAVGTHVKQGDWVGHAGSVGTGVKHLHFEQLYRAGSHDADTSDIQHPWFVELGAGHAPLTLVPGKPVVLVSQNGVTSPPTLEEIMALTYKDNAAFEKAIEDASYRGAARLTQLYDPATKTWDGKRHQLQTVVAQLLQRYGLHTVKDDLNTLKMKVEALLAKSS